MHQNKITEAIVQSVLKIFKRDDVKQEIKLLFKPIIDVILYEINPYIYITFAIVVIMFIMMSVILFLLLTKYKV